MKINDELRSEMSSMIHNLAGLSEYARGKDKDKIESIISNMEELLQ